MLANTIVREGFYEDHEAVEAVHDERESEKDDRL